MKYTNGPASSRPRERPKRGWPNRASSVWTVAWDRSVATPCKDGLLFRCEQTGHGRPARPVVLLLCFSWADSQCPPWRGRARAAEAKSKRREAATNGGGRDWRLGCHGKTRSHSLIEPVWARSWGFSGRCTTLSLRMCLLPAHRVSRSGAKTKKQCATDTAPRLQVEDAFCWQAAARLAKPIPRRWLAVPRIRYSVSPYQTAGKGDVLPWAEGWPTAGRQRPQGNVA